jgi:PIN domain nuclease of toxin-antitoxin system
LNGYLLDTSILLRAWHRPALVPEHMRNILSSGQPYSVSMATFWEIAIKTSMGKLETVNDPIEKARETNCKLLQIDPSHIKAVGKLPYHHRDPFDRMLIAQAQVERLVILTSDRQFSSYDVELA